MHVKVNGKIWDLQFVCAKELPRDAYGVCDGPSDPNKKIKIQKTLKGEHRLEIIIHELLHASFWQIDEKEISIIANDLARILTKLGYTDGNNKTNDGNTA